MMGTLIPEYYERLRTRRTSDLRDDLHFVLGTLDETGIPRRTLIRMSAWIMAELARRQGQISLYIWAENRAATTCDARGYGKTAQSKRADIRHLLGAAENHHGAIFDGN